MDGQSHSVHGGTKPVHGGTKPLGLRRDKATRYMEGQSHSVYERGKLFLIAIARMLQVSVLRIGPQPGGKPLGVCTLGVDLLEPACHTHLSYCQLGPENAVVKLDTLAWDAHPPQTSTS